MSDVRLFSGPVSIKKGDHIEVQGSHENPFLVTGSSHYGRRLFCLWWAKRKVFTHLCEKAKNKIRTKRKAFSQNCEMSITPLALLSCIHNLTSHSSDVRVHRKSTKVEAVYNCVSQIITKQEMLWTAHLQTLFIRTLLRIHVPTLHSIDPRARSLQTQYVEVFFILLFHSFSCSTHYNSLALP